jgi:hypothetical protein
MYGMYMYMCMYMCMYVCMYIGGADHVLSDMKPVYSDEVCIYVHMYVCVCVCMYAYWRCR